MRSLAPCKRKMAASAPVAALAARLIHVGSLKSNTANANRRKLAAIARWRTFSALPLNAIAVIRASGTPSNRMSAATTARSDRLDDTLRIASDTVNHPRRHGVLKRQPDEVNAWLLRDRAAVVPRVAGRVEDRMVDPVEAWLEATAPDDVAHIEYAPALEQRLTLACADDTLHEPHAGGGKIAALHPDAGCAFGKNARARLPTERRLHGEHVP